LLRLDRGICLWVRRVPLDTRRYRAVDLETITPVLALSHQTGVTMAEVAF
jgi:hypothetical protein